MCPRRDRLSGVHYHALSQRVPDRPLPGTANRNIPHL